LPAIVSFKTIRTTDHLWPFANDGGRCPGRCPPYLAEMRPIRKGGYPGWVVDLEFFDLL